MGYATIMKKILFCLFFIPVTCLAVARDMPEEAHHRSAEGKALKQTEMIVRELNINDTAEYHKLFDMYLRYARKYEEGCTRAQWLEQIEAMNKDLHQILTKEQYEAFMNKQMNEGPHSPKPQVGRFHQHPKGAPCCTGEPCAQVKKPAVRPTPQPANPR